METGSRFAHIILEKGSRKFEVYAKNVPRLELTSRRRVNSQYVNCRRLSPPSAVQCGVPQSVLGPILLLISAADLLRLIHRHSHAHTDDIQIFSSRRPAE